MFLPNIVAAGEITTLNYDGEYEKHEHALLITFNDAKELRAALENKKVGDCDLFRFDEVA
jgi:hypothetical protein